MKRYVRSSYDTDVKKVYRFYYRVDGLKLDGDFEDPYDSDTLSADVVVYPGEDPLRVFCRYIRNNEAFAGYKTSRVHDIDIYEPIPDSNDPYTFRYRKSAHYDRLP